MTYYLGIDLGGTKIAAGVIDSNGKIIARQNISTRPPYDVEFVMKNMADAAVMALRKAGLSARDIDSVGIGVPSTVNPVTHNVVFANNLRWKDVDVAGHFRKFLNIPVMVGNDADCAALGENIAGAARNFDYVLMLTLGTGVGGGIVINHKIFSGGNGFGCEPGHTTIVMDGEPCTCGRRGCLEAYASLTALVRDTIRAIGTYPDTIMRKMCGNDLNRVDGRLAFEAAKQNDRAALEVVHNYEHYLAVGISSLSTLLRPQAVILGGGISNQGEYLIAPIREEMNQTIYANDLIPSPLIMRAELGNDAGMIGAAFLAMK